MGEKRFWGLLKKESFDLLDSRKGGGVGLSGLLLFGASTRGD